MTTFTPDELGQRLSDEEIRRAFYERMIGRALLAILPFAQRRTPVRTGHLRRSETEAGGKRGFIGTNVVYAPFVHARIPFFQLGIDDSRQAVSKVLEDEGDAYFGQVLT